MTTFTGKFDASDYEAFYVAVTSAAGIDESISVENAANKINDRLAGSVEFFLDQLDMSLFPTDDLSDAQIVSALRDLVRDTRQAIHAQVDDGE